MRRTRLCPESGVLAFAICVLSGAVLLFPQHVRAQDAHPVTISAADADKAETCFQCHDDKKGKFTHSAITNLGCTSCHEVTTDAAKDETHISVPHNGNELCLQCHADKDPAQAKSRVHPPVAQNCLTCHSPHASENKYQLLKPTSVDATTSLCLSCHSKGVKDSGSRHAALDMGCDTCHITHKTGEAGKKEFEFHLTKSPPALCLDCHDAGDKQLATAHHDQPFATADCATCHDPHDSEAAKLIRPNAHPPFAGGMCESCHQPAKEGKIVLNEEGKFPLCYGCHDEVQKQVEGAKNPHPAFAAVDTCTTCHNPHASSYPRLLRGPQSEVCATCHERDKGEVLHGPYQNGECANCHEPHGGERARLLRAETNTLCMGCHKEGAAGVKVEQATVTLPWSRPLALKEYQEAVKLGLDSNGETGHPVIHHPISGKNTRVKNPDQVPAITCLSCHQPHGSALPKLMPAGLESPFDLCDQCHVAR